MKNRTIRSSQMRLINRSAILEYVRLNSPTSRTGIANDLDLSLPTVTRVVNGLFDEHLLIESGQASEGIGRSRNLLSYNKEAYSVIGIDLGGTKLYGALANIGGQIMHEVTIEHHETTDEESLALVVSMVADLLAHAPADQPVRGIAVGAPGVTDNHNGIVEWAPSLNWRDYPLRDRLEDRFGLSVCVDNDVNLAVLGEHWFGTGQGVQNMVLISIGTGVGAGLIVDGALHRGFSKASGEVGYLVPSIRHLNRTYEGFGALEQIVSGTAIGERGAKHRPSNGKPASVRSEDVFAAARRGEPWAEQVIEETIDYLALAIANINTILDVELIVLSGGVARQSDLLISGVYKRINGVIPRTPRIEESILGRRATVLGAIVMVVHATDNYYVVRKLS